MPAEDHAEQLRAIAWLRWRLFVNTLRSTRGQLELFSRVLVSFAFVMGGLGGAALMGTAAFLFLSTGRPEMLALLLWAIFFFWQVFPILATTLTNNPDSSDLLRYPLGYRSYFLVRLAYGICDPATFLGSLWSFGVLMGVAIQKPALLPWACFVLFAFIAFNLLFMQMVFAWVERWLAQRRSRELLGILFVLGALSFQLVGPVTRHVRRHSHSGIQERFLEILAPAQRLLPPGLAADAIVHGIYPQWPAAISSITLLGAFSLLAGYGLHSRLRAQYRGESLSEAAAPSTPQEDRAVRLAWNVPGLAGPVAAVLEKEIRYLLRSGPLLLTLAMPIFVLFIFRFGAMNSARHSGGFLVHASSLAFPAAAGYTLLMLTNLVYNNFGGDAAGIQFLYASPASFREIVQAKNLMHSSILAAEMALAWIVVTLLYSRPALEIVVVTIAGLLFATPINFAAGNLLSIYAPRKLDYSRFGRQRASQITVLFSIALQFLVIGVGIGCYLTASHFGNLWIATLVLLALAAISLLIYALVLRRIDSVALQRRETLITELCRA
jgi:ABC-2 type transport system permease protein